MTTDMRHAGMWMGRSGDADDGGDSCGEIRCSGQGRLVALQRTRGRSTGHGVMKGRLGSGECSRRRSTLSLRTERTEREGLPLHTTYSNVSFSAEKTWNPGSLEACYAP